MTSSLDSPTISNSVNIQFVRSHWQMGPALNGLPQWLSSKESTCNTEDSGEVSSIPGSGRSPGGEHGNPFQYSCLENPMDRGVWQSTVHGAAKSQIPLKQLSMHASSTPSSKHINRDTPGDPEAKTVLPKQRTQVWSLLRELDSTCSNYKILHYTTKTWLNQNKIDKYFKNTHTPWNITQPLKRIHLNQF